MSKTPHKSKNKHSKASKESKSKEDFMIDGQNILDENFISEILDHRKPGEKHIGFFFGKDARKTNSESGIESFAYISTDPIIDLGPKKQPLQVMFSSTEHENEQLLHFLFNKSKS